MAMKLANMHVDLTVGRYDPVNDRVILDKHRLTTDSPHPEAKPDGERASVAADPCEACRERKRCAFSGDGEWRGSRTGPFTWLQGHVYCEVCYPKMVAVLEADARLAAMRTPILTTHMGSPEDELRALGIEYHGPFKTSNDDAEAIRTHAFRIASEECRREYWNAMPGDKTEMRIVEPETVHAALQLPNPILCPATGCNNMLGSTDGERFEPADIEYVTEKEEQPNGTTVYLLRCPCGKERRWPG